MSKSLDYQVLLRARALVEMRSTWTRHCLALTRNRRECDPTDPRAVRFCAYGALVRGPPTTSRAIPRGPACWLAAWPCR